MLVETTCGRLFVDVAGEGPPLVLWHSLLCDGAMWRHQIAALRESHRLVNIDAPGHGRSAPTVRGYTMDDCVRAGVAVLDDLSIERAVWCGLSWGGMVGMRLAVRFPERLAGLVLMDTSARRENPVKKPGYRVLAAIARTLGPMRLLSAPILPLFLTARTRTEQPELAEDFVETLMRMDPASLGHAVDAVILDRDDVSGELGRIDVPTLIVVGEEDRATPPAESEHLARLIPRARLVRVPGAAHLSCLEQPERVNAELERFLAGLSER